MKNCRSCLAAAFILLLAGSQDVKGQDKAVDEELFVVTRADSVVHLYHTVQLGLVNGFHVERRTDADEEWRRLTVTPVFPVSDGREFRSVTGDLFPLLQETMEEESPQEVFLSMMTRRQYAFPGSALYPEVAEALGRLYVDEDPPVGETADYRLIVTDSNGEPTGETLDGSFLIEPRIPEAPHQLSGSYEATEITLEWEYPVRDFIEDGVSRFMIYVHDGDSEELLSEQSVFRRTDDASHTYRITVDELNREYEIFVVAVDAAGQQSEPSESITLIPEDNVPPEQILNIDAQIMEEEQAVELSWPVSPDPDAAGYHIFRSERDEDEEFRQITEEPLDLIENRFLDTTITGPRHYDYRIRVYDEHGNESDPSNVTSVFVEPFEAPDPISGLDAVLDEEGTVQLSWDAPASGDLDTYMVLRRKVHPGYEEAYALVNDDDFTDPRLTDEGISGVELPEGRTFEYGIVAIGPGALHSDTVFTEIHIPLETPPDPPVNLEVSSADADRVIVNWSASPSMTVTDYLIYRMEVSEDKADELPEEDIPEDEYRIARTEFHDRFFRDEEAEPGRTYRYMVTALDSAGNESEALDQILEHRSASAPQPVRNLQARAIDDEIMLRWEPSRTDDLDGYLIYRSEAATGGFEVIAEAEEEDTEWHDPEGSPGMWYRVTAVDRSGNESSTLRATQADE